MRLSQPAFRLHFLHELAGNAGVVGLVARRRGLFEGLAEEVEHLLLGRYPPGTTILVDKGTEAGLEIHAADQLAPAAVEAG